MTRPQSRGSGDEQPPPPGRSRLLQTRGPAPTMRDVAAAAGVSLKSVSRVVNGEAHVTVDLRTRVDAAIAELGYRHNHAASFLRSSSRRTRAVGVVVQDLGNDYCAQFLHRVEARLRTEDLVVIASGIDEEPTRERAVVAELIARRVDAIILMPASSSQAYLQRDVDAGLPVVVVDRPAVELTTDCVVADNVRAACEATAHLLDQGHSRILGIFDLPTIATSAQRHHGFIAAHESVGLLPERALVVDGVRTAAQAEDVVTRFVTGVVGQRPTAIFAARNSLTVGAARALARGGLSDTVALVGFDDIAMAEMVSPGLTVVRQNVAAIADVVVDLVLSRLAGDDLESRTVVVPTELIRRGSGEIAPIP